MPRYIYTCECGGEKEELRRISERDDPVTCPECGGEMSRVLFVETARPQFKGPGFYETEYRYKS
jgi:putative FmdB family regulatory protein